jgi:hypothetical protein
LIFAACLVPLQWRRNGLAQQRLLATVSASLVLGVTFGIAALWRSSIALAVAEFGQLHNDIPQYPNLFQFALNDIAGQTIARSRHEPRRALPFSA